jgi:hypothetical protein
MRKRKVVPCIGLCTRNRSRLASFALALAIACTLTISASAQSSIISGAPWKDTSGNLLAAHGAGILKVGSTYYMIGENDSSGGGFQGINCYSSTNLTSWTFVRDVLPPQASGDLVTSNLIERPKVLFNSSTSKYVMWVHVYNGDKVGYATSSSVCGTYTYQGSSEPLGNESFDIGSFQDTDGTAYLLSANFDNGIIVYKMASDYLSPVSIVDGVSTWGDREAPAMFKIGSTYYLICSHETGWASNDDQYSTAPAIGGPWTALANIATAGTNTWDSQSTFVLPVTGSGGTTYIYMGDRWISGAINNSSYIWLPLTVSGTTLSLPWVNNWTLNVGAGTWANASFSSLQTGAYHELVNMNSGMCLDAVNTTEGTQEQGIYCGTGTANLQQWELSAAGSNYKIASQATAFLSEDEGNSKAPSSPIDSWPNNGGLNQEWTITSNGQGNYTVKNAYSGLCLGVTSAAITSGSPIDEGTCNGGTNQMWYQR